VVAWDYRAAGLNREGEGAVLLARRSNGARAARGARGALRKPCAVLVAVCLAHLVAACAGKVPPPPETHLTLEVTASAQINPDPSGRASPVALSVLQLKTADAFMNADFFAASDPANAALATEVVGREEVTLKPGETRQLPVKVDAAAVYIGVIAAFRDIEHASWRAQMPLPVPPKGASGPQDVTMVIRVDALKLSIEPASR
jgi:type VI secretion system protein VasD